MIKEFEDKTKEELVETILELKKEVIQLKNIDQYQELYSQIVEQSREAIAVTDFNGNYIFINSSYEALRGYSREEIINKRIPVSFPEEDRDEREKAYNHVMDSGMWKGEMRFIKPDGTIVPTICTSMLLRNKEGHSIAIAGLFTDVSEIKEAEKNILIAKQQAEEANKAKSYFLANMSHEIRTPLNALLGFSDILLEDEPNISKKETISIIKDAGMQLLDLINDILDLSKIESGKFQIYNSTFSIRDLMGRIGSMFKSIAQTKRLNYKITISKTFPDFILSDERITRQIILNLLSNAFKFTDQGEVQVKCTSNENSYTLQISDTGIGIPKDKIDMIFENFQQVHDQRTRQVQGTGLGLSITRQLILLMEGSITVDSEENNGTTFTITIPFEAASRPLNTTDNEDSSTEKNQIPGLKILVAEDNVVNQKLLKSILERWHCIVTMAEDGQKTVEALEKESFDVLLLDMEMPVMNGEDVIKYIENKPYRDSLSIILQTAYAMKGDMERFIAMGAEDYISKPIDRDLLFQKLSNLK